MRISNFFTPFSPVSSLCHSPTNCLLFPQFTQGICHFLIELLFYLEFLLVKRDHKARYALTFASEASYVNFEKKTLTNSFLPLENSFEFLVMLLIYSLKESPRIFKGKKKNQPRFF